MGSSEGQTYCLRWNNHKSNLVEILDALIKMESYVDCTIVVDEQVQFKAHRVVLAANSPYFQSILQDVPMDHCSILFPGVQAFEMRALLEYMYTGEVNVTQSQIPRIMKIAEQLEVKGLFDMTDLKEKFTKFEDNGPPNHSPYNVPFPPPPPPPPPPSSSSQASGVGGITAPALTPPTFRESSKDINRDIIDRESHHHFSHSLSHHRSSSSSSSLNLERSNNERRLSSSERRLSGDREREYRDRSGHRSSSSAAISDLHHQQQQQQHQQSSPVITTSSNITQHQAQSSSSPPPSYLYKSPYSSLYTKSPGPSESRRTIDDRNERERYSSSSDRHERQERGLLSERSTERLHDRHSSSQQQQQRQITPPPPPPPPPASTQQHTPWGISSVIGSGSIPTSAAAAAMLSSVYESAPDMNPLKRKKLSSISSMLMASDTPILRNVLAQSHAADSSQPMPLVKQERDNEKQLPLNCSGPSDYNNDKYGKYDEPHSPFIDKSFDDEPLEGSPNERLGNLSYSSSNNSQKPEWKRYKQYTRSDILAAIECVRNGMSALQASRKFGVPSRTLYDKVKKLGITTGRPMNRTLKRSPSTGSSSASFPFGLSGTTHPAYSQAEAMLSQIHESNELHSSHLRGNSNGSNGNGNVDKEHREHHLPPNLPHPAAAALLDPTFLQQAFESRGGDIAGREALHAMALAAAAHAAVNGISTSPGTNGTARSPSPGFALKYSRSHQNSPPPSSTTGMNLNRTSSSSSSTLSRLQPTSVPQDSDQQHTTISERNRDRDCRTKYERELDDDDEDDDDDDDDDENSRSSRHDRNLKNDNDLIIPERREHELIERNNRNRLSRKRNLIEIENEQDRVEDLSVNRKEKITTTQRNIHSPSPQPLSPSSSSHMPHSPQQQQQQQQQIPPPSISRSPSTHQSNNDNNNHHHHHHHLHHLRKSPSYNNNNNNSGNQQSTGVIMPPIITKLNTNATTINETTADYPVSHESTSAALTTTTSATGTALKRELIAEDETRD